MPYNLYKRHPSNLLRNAQGRGGLIADKIIACRE